MHDTAAAGQDTDSVDNPIWFLPAGAVRGKRNRNRARGWLIVAGAALALWAVIGLGIWALVAYFSR